MITILVGVIILTIVGLISTRIETKVDIKPQSNQETQTPTPTPTSTPTITPKSTPASTSTTSPAPASPSPPTPGVPDNNLEFQYPNSVQIKSENNVITYESSDNPDVITNWYKDKIKSLKLNAKSFVTTKTNGNVLNKLVGADGQKEIRVEISKKDSESKVNIIVIITMTS